jgi:hypothetical protein
MRALYDRRRTADSLTPSFVVACVRLAMALQQPVSYVNLRITREASLSPGENRGILLRVSLALQDVLPEVMRSLRLDPQARAFACGRGGAVFC